MANAVLSDPRFHNEDAAFAYVEERIWPNGPTCPHCGNVDAAKIGSLNARTKPSKKNPEGLPRHGLRKCYACRQEFTVRVGSIFEDSHLPLHLWLQAIHLLASGKKGVSTRHIQRLLNCSMKTAWFLTHRIREIMKSDSNAGPLGGAGMMIEADETYYGTKPGRQVRRGTGHKRVIVSLVERGGDVRSFHVETADTKTVRTAVLHRYLNGVYEGKISFTLVETATKPTDFYTLDGHTSPKRIIHERKPFVGPPPPLPPPNPRANFRDELLKKWQNRPPIGGR